GQAKRSRWPDRSHSPQPPRASRIPCCARGWRRSPNSQAACPTVPLFASAPVPSGAAPRSDARFPCGVAQAFPLASARGETALVLLVLDQRTPPRPPEPAPARTEPPPPGGREALGGVIGRSPAMHQLFEMMALVADSSATV